MHLTFEGQLFEWRGPSPFHFIAIPDDDRDAVAEAAAAVTYGWGVVPVRARIGSTEFTTSLFPKDGGYLLPVKDIVRRAEGLSIGEGVTVDMAIGRQLGDS
jgi:hypothetical protein